MRLSGSHVVVAGVLAAACASTEPPPGGPPDDAPPFLIAVTPDTGAVNVRPGAVVFRFNEVIRERPATGATLDARFLISPVTGGVEADWRRSSIEVKGRRGWRPNTTYTVTMLGGIADLRGNVLDSGRTVVFSTGPTIARSALRGVVFDWVAGRVAPNAYIEAMSLPDSTVYVTAADSVGTFVLGNIPPGSYRVRGVLDANSNRAVDLRELWDTLGVTVGDSARVEILTHVHDSTPPRVVRAVVPDTFTIRVSLDRPLDTARAIDTSLFTLRAADSTVVRLAEVRRATAVERETPPVGVPRPGAVPPPAVPLPADTTPRLIVQARVPSRPSPVTEIVITVATALRTGAEYRLVLREARGLEGSAATTSFVVTVPARQVPRPATPPPP